jgi:uncharacterized repeat protein (TIGR02543 family)
VFPETAAGTQTALRVLTVTNDGPVNIRGRKGIQWSIEGPDAADLTLEPSTPSDPNDCRYHHFIQEDLRVGQSCQIGVMFRPLTTGPKQATLRAWSDSVYHRESDGAAGGPLLVDQTFSMVATAVATPARPYTSSPDLYVASLSGIDPVWFLIVNNGASSVDLGAPVVTAPFTFGTWNCPSPLTPGGACSASVGIANNQAGCPTGHFTTTTSALTLPLTARGVPSSLTVEAYKGTVRIDPVGVTCTNGTCPVTLPSPADVTLTATPEPGGHFLGWYQTLTGVPHPCGASPTCVLAAGFANLHLIARFASAAAKAISITISGTGEVSTYFMRCAASCTVYTEPGNAVTLSARTRGTFAGWSGDCTGTSPSCNLGTVVNDRAVTATFHP